MRHLILIVSVYLCTVVFQSCKKEETAALQTGSVTFRTYAVIEYNGNKKETEAQTFILPCKIKFKAEGADSCWWKVGHDPRVIQGKEFYLDFEVYNTDEKLLVSLITKKNRTGNLWAETYDTLTRTITFNAVGHTPLLGRYIGHNEGEAGQNFEIEIDTIQKNTLDKWPHVLYFVKNLPNGCLETPRYIGGGDNDGGTLLLPTYNSFIVSRIYGLSDNSCPPYLSGYGVLDTVTEKLRISYEYKDPKNNFQATKKTFVGVSSNTPLL